MHARFKSSTPRRARAANLIDLDVTDAPDPDAPDTDASDAGGREAAARQRARDLRTLERDARELRARAAREATDLAHDDDVSDASDTNPRLRPVAFRERHALKVMGAIMAAAFAMVVVAQVGC